MSRRAPADDKSAMASGDGKEGRLTRALEVLGVSVDEGVGGDVANVDHFDLEKGESLECKGREGSGEVRSRKSSTREPSATWGERARVGSLDAPPLDHFLRLLAPLCSPSDPLSCFLSTHSLPTATLARGIVP